MHKINFYFCNWEYTGGECCSYKQGINLVMLFNESTIIHKANQTEIEYYLVKPGL